jgi:hypothetical protein
MIKIRAEALLLSSLALVYGALESCGPPEPSISLGVSNGVSRPPRCFDAGASIQVDSVSVHYKDCTTAQERVALDFRHEILLPEDVFHGCYPLPPSAFQRSLVNWHNPRLRSVIRRIRSGLPITIVTLGGSVAYGNEAGGPLFASSHWFVRWLQQRYPKAIVTHHNLARGATDSIWILANFDMISRYQPHLILYDYSTNDISSTAGLEPSKMRSITEAVVRTLFSLPSSPALIQLVIFRSPRQGRDSMLLEIETKGIEPVAKYYNYTLISYRNAVWPALDSPPSGGVIAFKKTHPMW